MATIIDAKEWILTQLKDGLATGTIGGKIYIDKKPLAGSEDIVINALLTDSDFFQNTVLNVNCYVPDIDIKVSGKVVNVPDRTRLKAISTAVYAVLKDNFKNQVYRSYVESMQQIQEIGENAHFVNFRVQLYAKNN